MPSRSFPGPARVLAALAAVLALIPLAAGAQAPVSIAERAPSASVEGIVSSVSGTTVGILEDLVKIDVSGAVIRSSAPGGAPRPEPGDRVVATVKPSPSGGLLVAETLLILDMRPGSIRGLLDAVDPAQKTITVLGLRIHVDGNTSIGGLPAGNIPTITDLRVGQNLLVELEPRSGQLYATRILVLNPNPVNEIRFEGAVKSISVDAWVFTVGPDPRALGPAAGSEITVKITAQTRIVGSPKVGDRCFVVAQIQNDQTLVAISIERRETPPTEVFRVVGTVKRIAAGLWTIGIVCAPGQICPATPDTVVRVDERTVLEGDPKLGDYVLAEAEITDGGAGIPHARSIRKLTQGPPGTVRLSGNVKSIAPDKWVITFPSFTTPAVEATLLISSETKIEGDPKVGDQVSVEAVPTPTPLTYRAIRITKVSSDPSSRITFVGYVRKIESDRWTIGLSQNPSSDAAEYTVRVTRETRITGDPKVGDQVKVEAQRSTNAPGELVAISITKVVASAGSR